MNETLLLLGLMLPLLLGAWLGGQMLPNNWLAATNAFSGAFLFAVTVFLWMPTLAESSHIGSVPSSTWGLWIVIGYFLQFALDGLSKGLEHGHAHGHGNPWPAFIGLWIHSFAEAVPLFGLREDSHAALVISLGVHNLPIAALVASWLRQQGISTRQTWLAMGSLGLAPMLGAAAGWFIPEHPLVDVVVGSLVVGIFLHVSSTILLEVQKDHRIPLRTWGIVLVGIAAGYVLSGYAGHSH